MNEFGKYLRRKRMERGLSLKYLAEVMGISSVYLCDVERGRRNSFDLERLEVIAKELKMGKEETNKLMDLAGFQRDEIAPDISKYILENEPVKKALRVAKDAKSDDSVWMEFIKKMEERKW